MSNAGKKIIAAATEALAVARGEEPAASITVNGHTYVPADRVRTLEAELSKAREAQAANVSQIARLLRLADDNGLGDSARASLSKKEG